MPKTVKVVITGRVQGVFFRNWTKKNAEKLGLKGTVRNLPTGDVEAVFQGAEDKIAKMLALCHEGSRMAKVQDIRVENLQNADNYVDFRVMA